MLIYSLFLWISSYKHYAKRDIHKITIKLIELKSLWYYICTCGSVYLTWQKG